MKPGSMLLNDYSWGYRSARVLHMANKLDLFTVLGAEDLGLAEICDKCKSKPAMTEKLLIACVAMGLVEKTRDKYKNSAVAADYLVRGGALYQWNIIAHSEHVQGLWDNFEDQLYLDAPPKDDEAKQHRDFIMGMDNITAAGRGQIFLDNIDLSGRKKLLDVGGGPGSYSISACRMYPELTAVLFDLPETVEIAKEVIARENMQDRITLRPGNWDTDSFGEGFDAALLSNVMHGADYNAEMKLSKAYDCLIRGGLLVVQEFVLNDDKTGPLIPALFNIMVGAFSRRDLVSVIEKAGFTDCRVVFDCEQMGATWLTAEK